MSKYLFIVQGEGRGHLTQAISLAQILQQNGHEVVQVLVGVGEGRQLPTFFTQQIQAPVQTFHSPHLMMGKKGISFAKTIGYHLFRLWRYVRSVAKIKSIVRAQSPDVIVNFYDVLGGIYAFLYRSNIPLVAVGHHYLFFHPEMIFPQKRGLDHWLLKINTYITALQAEKLLALSFQFFQDQPQSRIVVTPPLLRQAVHGLYPTQQNYLLAYVTYTSLSNNIVQWHLQNPTIPLHCFWDNAQYNEEYVYDETLTFHQVDGQKYLQMMADCKALVTTAGFESVCEAMYLGKPVMMVPAHYEQACNALDAQKAGAGVAADTFDLSILLDYLPQHQLIQDSFQHWCSQASAIFLQHLEEVVGEKQVLVGFS
ncbi:MAG: glycosyltransferase family protein [Spirosomataceae bacterium]